MKLEVKYLFPTSSSGVNFYIYQLPEGLGMRKMLAHGVVMRKNQQTREYIFWIFMHFHGVMRVQSPTCTHTRKFYQQHLPDGFIVDSCKHLKPFDLICDSNFLVKLENDGPL